MSRGPSSANIDPFSWNRLRRYERASAFGTSLHHVHKKFIALHPGGLKLECAGTSQMVQSHEVPFNATTRSPFLLDISILQEACSKGSMANLSRPCASHSPGKRPAMDSSGRTASVHPGKRRIEEGQDDTRHLCPAGPDGVGREPALCHFV
jgi:hypothetical protein